MMSRLLLLTLLLAGSAGAASAQLPEPDLPTREETQGLMDFARQAMNPAAAVLASRQELSLTAAQISTLDSLAAPLNLFLDEQLSRRQPTIPAALLSAMRGGSAPIDEEAIRAGYRQQADLQAELMIRMVRMERSVARVLTPEQEAKRQTLHMNSMMGMMRAMGAAATTPGQ